MANHEIRSPLPGTFYHKPAPDQPPFKSAGDKVVQGEVIGLIEVMKSFHEITSDADGTISGYAVDNEEPVMAGQVLANVET